MFKYLIWQKKRNGKKNEENKLVSIQFYFCVQEN